MSTPELPIESGAHADSHARRQHHPLVSRFWTCLRWDCRWVVVVATLRADLHAILAAVAAIAIGAFGLPYAILHALLRWPCKPVYWLWVAWRQPENVERIREVMAKAANDQVSNGQADHNQHSKD